MVIFVCAVIGFWIGLGLLVALDAFDADDAWLMLVMLFALLGAFVGLLITGVSCSNTTVETSTQHYLLQDVDANSGYLLEEVSGKEYIYNVDGKQTSVSGDSADITVVHDDQNSVEIIKSSLSKESCSGFGVKPSPKDKYVFHVNEEQMNIVP